MRITNIINHCFDENNVNLDDNVLLYECDVKHYSYAVHVKVFTCRGHEKAKELGFDSFYKMIVHGKLRGKRLGYTHIITNPIWDEKTLLNDVVSYSKYLRKSNA